MDSDVYYSCSFCHNDYTINQGYNPKTKQCKGCDDWDNKGKKEQVDKIKLNNLPEANFPYVPGDPFW